MKLSQLAYQQFKECLLTGRIKAGSVTLQADLAQMVGVPIGALREAIQVLEAEGLVTVMPRSGIRIVQPDLKLLANAYQLRRVLEREAVIKFTMNCPTAMLDDWEQKHRGLIDEVDAGLDQPELGDRIDQVDLAFHVELIQALRNPLIEDIFRKNMERLVIVRLDQASVTTPFLVRLSLAEHLKVIAAMRERDPEAAAAAMDEHLSIAMQRGMGS